MKKDLPTTDKNKKIPKQEDSVVLSLHPIDSSDNNNNMSINSDEGNTDIYI